MIKIKTIYVNNCAYKCVEVCLFSVCSVYSVLCVLFLCSLVCAAYIFVFVSVSVCVRIV